MLSESDNDIPKTHEMYIEQHRLIVNDGRHTMIQLLWPAMSSVGIFVNNSNLRSTCQT
jgi:hypothetical protein